MIGMDGEGKNLERPSKLITSPDAADWVDAWQAVKEKVCSMQGNSHSQPRSFRSTIDTRVLHKKKCAQIASSCTKVQLDTKDQLKIEG
jgi:hypothetical protein